MIQIARIPHAGLDDLLASRPWAKVSHRAAFLRCPSPRNSKPWHPCVLVLCERYPSPTDVVFLVGEDEYMLDSRASTGDGKVTKAMATLTGVGLDVAVVEAATDSDWDRLQKGELPAVEVLLRANPFRRP